MTNKEHSQTTYVSQKKKRGFTLTEIAIVLGIIGLILGAIWVAAAAVYNNLRISRTQTQLLQITQAVRAMYATSTTVDATADMVVGAPPLPQTAGALTYIQAGIFPVDALNGAPSAATYANTPWGNASDIDIYSATSPGGLAADSFAIMFNGIPSQGCSQLLVSATGQGRDPGMWGAFGGKSGGKLTTPAAAASGLLTAGSPLSASAATTACIAGGAGNKNAATFWFTVRG